MSTLSFSAIMSERTNVGRQSADVSRSRPKFDVQRLSFWYGPQQALYDVALTIPERSVVALIGASDLMHQTIERVSFYQRPFEFYTAVAVIYLVMVVIVAQLATRLEKRLQRHLA